MGGGATSESFLGNGHSGGDLIARASGAIRLASVESGPSAPSLPAAPTTGTELTNAMITAGAPIAGNILVSSTLQIAAGVNPATITTNTGDVVIRGSLFGERSAGTVTNDIAISAPAGTIYVIGEIRTPGTAGAPVNPDGGDITLTAMRIVIAGSIDARGLSNPTGTGGNGGSVMIDTTGGGGTEILFTSGSMAAMGGDGGAQGGNGGDITLRAGTRLSVFSPVLAHGGSASATGVTAFAGHGGDVTLSGGTGADISASVSLGGGIGTGYSQGALGGDGGHFTADGAGPWTIFGSITTSGGSATAPAGSSLEGGTAGSVRIGLGTPVTALDLGRGSYNTSGGSGKVTAGNAGSIDVASLDGNITVGGALTARGGGLTTDNPGLGGTVTIVTDADALGNSSNHLLTASTAIDTRGGRGSSSGGGGAVLLQCAGDLEFTGVIDTSGYGGGGDAGSVSFIVDAANLAPDGALTVLGTIEAGVTRPGNLSPGNGGAVLLSCVGDLTFSAALSTKGGASAGGQAGSITIQSATGNINISGSISARGLDPSTFPPQTPGNLTVSTAGNIVFDAVIDVSAPPPHPGNSNVKGADGGTVSFTCTGAAGSITLLAGSDIRANGGDSTPGTAQHSGGAGGRILFSTVDQAVFITGTLTAKGGAASTAPSTPGGLGGQVVINSDSDGNGTGGAITLTAGSVIDVSGAAGFDAGDALNNGGVAPTDSSGTNLAVVFDAAGGLTASPDGGGEGTVRNLGTIIATGGSIVARGGDIWFDGRNGSGADMGPGDGGILTLTGAGGNGTFFPN